MTAFDTRVEIAFDSGYQTAAASRNWTDVTGYVEAQNAFTITRGRQDEWSTINPSTLTGLVLNNTDGRFTPELSSGAYYPNVKKGRPIRVRLRYPAGQPGNFLTPNQASMETSIADWSPGGSVHPTLAQSTTHAADGTNSLLITWGAGSGVAQTQVTGLTAGRTYTSQARVWVPVGSPNVKLWISGISWGAASSGTGAFVSISYTFTASSSTHTLMVTPDTTPTSGQQVWVDSVMVDEGSAAQTFTTTAPPFVERFLGYVDEWAVSWPSGGDTYSICTVAASSRNARLAKAAALRSLIQEETALDSPALQYPLGESNGATAAGDASGNAGGVLSVTQLGTGGTLDFGTGTGPGTDGLSAPTFTPASAGDGKYLSGSVQVGGITATTAVLEAFFNTSTATAAQAIATLGLGGAPVLYLTTDATGKLVGTYQYSGLTITATSTTSVADGHTHYGAVRAVTTSTQTTLSVVLDGTVTTPAPSDTAVGYFGFDTLTVGGPNMGTPGGLFTGVVAQVGAYASGNSISDARLQAHSDAGLNGFAGETVQARLARYCSYLGLPTAEQSFETGLMTGVSHVDTTGASALDLMQRVAITSEDGLLFDGRDGSLVFQARSHRYNAASAVTLDASVSEVEADFAPKLDDQAVLNDVTVSRPAGISVRSVNSSSIADLGYYRDNIEILTTSDNEVQSAADWKVSRRGVPHVKTPALSVDLLTFPTASKIATILGVDLGAEVTATNLPSQAPATSVDVFVEGTKETIGIARYDVSWNVSPVGQSQVWQLDSASYSQLDNSTVLAY